MLLSGEDIKTRIADKSLVIRPFNGGLVKPAGYDLRCGDLVKIGAREYSLTFTLEWIEMPLDLAGILHLRSSFIREGLLGGLSLVDPGFKGQLTIAIFNGEDKPVTISKGESLVQISFIKLLRPALKGYSGKYRFSRGVIQSRR